jgi:DNA-binding transcriptional LysR family regulator
VNIRKLNIFYKTAEYLNMSKVAKEMYISQPSISQCISEIEEEIGAKLFDRIGKKLYLTHEGKIFYDYTRRILNIYEEGVNIIKDSKVNSGKITVGVSTTIGIYIMPYIIKKFNEKEKDIEISLIIDNKYNIEELILNNKVDIGFMEGKAESSEIILKEIWKDELVFISAIDHEWKEKKYLTVDDLVNNKFIIREDGSGTRERFEDFLDNNNIKFDSYIELSNLEAIINYVKLNIAVSCVPYISVLSEEKSKLLNVSRLKDCTIKRSLYSAIHRDKYVSKPIKTFIDFCENTEIFLVK